MRKLLLVLLILSVRLSAQNQKPGAAPISCTSSVQAAICKDASRELSASQDFPLISQVEFVIADADSFAKENDRLRVRHENEERNAETSKMELRQMIRVHNLGPTAPSMDSDSVLFVLNENRSISKVVIAVDSFRRVEKLTVDKDGNPHLVRGDYDPQLLFTKINFIIGYLDGWKSGQLDMLMKLQ
jgi:hypothetical protein